MFSKEVFDLLKQVITSWQVIAVTIALVLYLFLVFHAASTYRRPRLVPKEKKVRKKKAAAPAGPEEADPGSDVNDELGLEED